MATDTASPETREKYAKSPLWKPWMKDIRLRQATAIEEVQEFLELGEPKPIISWDVETESLDPEPTRVCGHCLSFDGEEGLYIPVRHKTNSEQNLDPDRVFDLIIDVIQRKTVAVYNWKFEGEILRRRGAQREANLKYIRDVLIYVWLYDSNRKRLNLKDASDDFLKMEMLEIHEVPGARRGKKKGDPIDFSYTDPEDATLYAAADPVMTLRILNKIGKEVDDEQPFIIDMEHRLLDCLFDIENNELYIDRAFLNQGTLDLKRWIKTLEAEIYKTAGYQFNIGSSDQVGKYLVSQGVKLGETKTGKLATNAKEIEKMAEDHPVVERILLYRSLIKELSTYVLPLLSATSDNEPYTRFKIKSVGAPTGRFAAGGVEPGETKYADMNVQAIPSASAFKIANAKKVLNPPISELDSVLSVGNIQADDFKGDLLEDDDTEE